MNERPAIRHLFRPDGDRAPVGVEAFHFRDFAHRRQGGFEAGLVVFDKAGAPLKLVDRKPRERNARAAGRQGMAWSGNVVAQNGGRKVAQENRASR